MGPRPFFRIHSTDWIGITSLHLFIHLKHTLLHLLLGSVRRLTRRKLWSQLTPTTLAAGAVVWDLVILGPTAAPLY